VIPVLRVGAKTPVGPTSLATATASRVPIFEPRPTSTRDRHGIPIGAARCRGIPDDVTGFDRFVQLGAPALREAAFGVVRPVPLVLAIPAAARADQSARFDKELCDALAAKSGVPIDLAKSQIVRGENSAFAAAVEVATSVLATQAHVLVGAIDTYVHPELLRSLDEDARLHSPAQEGGFLPSEAAAFALVGDTRGMPPALGSLLAAARATERSVATGSDMAVDATALVRRLVREAGLPSDAWCITDQNPEFCRARTLRFLLPRLDDELGEAHFEAIPDWCGDVGTATGALALAVACKRWATGSAPRKKLLVWLQDDGPGRGAVAATAPPDGDDA